MKEADDRPRIRWWEYPWYGLVLLFFALVGAAVLITDLLRGRVGRLGADGLLRGCC